MDVVNLYGVKYDRNWLFNSKDLNQNQRWYYYGLAHYAFRAPEIVKIGGNEITIQRSEMYGELGGYAMIINERLGGKDKQPYTPKMIKAFFKKMKKRGLVSYSIEKIGLQNFYRLHFLDDELLPLWEGK